jgi:hypothetical protein
MGKSIAEAVEAARGVNQRAVQGSTKGIQRSAAKMGAPDQIDKRAYDMYRRQMTERGMPATSFAQWQMMNRHAR